MKTKITFSTVLLFFICFLSSLNSHSQKILTSLTETWKNETWKNLVQTLNTYDGNGYLIHDLTQSWNVSWKDSFQTDYTNNPDGTAQQSISQSWNTLANGWENVQRENYTYTATKKVLISESEFWNSTDWFFSSKETNAYDGSDYLTNSLLQTYDFITPWKDAYQTIYNNNPDGTVNQATSQIWNVNVWNNEDRITYTYNSSKLIMSLSEKWNGTIWENSSMDTYEYDGSGYLIYLLSQNWVSNSWINDAQFFITNYGNGNPYQIISQTADTSGLVWTNVSRITFTNTSLGVDERIFEKSLAAYPNPADDNITIKTNENSVGMKYVIADQLGRQFLNGTITNRETVIDINQLSTGVYFIKVGQNKNQVLKVVKK